MHKEPADAAYIHGSPVSPVMHGHDDDAGSRLIKVHVGPHVLAPLAVGAPRSAHGRGAEAAPPPWTRQGGGLLSFRCRCLSGSRTFFSFFLVARLSQDCIIMLARVSSLGWSLGLNGVS